MAPKGATEAPSEAAYSINSRLKNACGPKAGAWWGGSSEDLQQGTPAYAKSRGPYAGVKSLNA
jgi:hypothetical protein